MKLFDGKSKSEKYKIIAAVVLGVLAVIAVGYNLAGFFMPRRPSTTSTATPTPTVTSRPAADAVVTALPPQSEIDNVYASTPVVYPLVSLGAPEAGRNIFAFYEPPVPTPFSPTPTPVDARTPPPPSPTPTPPQAIFGFNPPNVYAGSPGFNLDVNGNGFTPETRIFINNMEMPTTFAGAQRLTTNVPSNFIAGGGALQIFVRTPDGKLYSLPAMLNIQTPPRPQFQYVGLVSPRLGNNRTAYLQEGNNQPVARRLDDRIGNCTAEPLPGCFRIVDISRERVIVQDVKLGFRYPIEINRIASPTGSGSGTTTNPNFPNPNFPNPNMQNPSVNPNCPPGIPCTNPQPIIIPNPNATPQKKDVDDNDPDDGDRL